MNSVPHSEPLSSPPEVNIRDFLEVLRRRRAIFLNVFVTVLLVGILTSLPGKPVYQTYAKLVVPSRSYGFSFVNSSNPFEAMLAAAQPDDLETQLQVLQSPEFIQEAIRRAGITPKPSVAPPAVSVSQVERSSVIQVNVSGGDPRDIASVANAVVELHLEKTDLLATTGLQDTKDFVQQEKEKAAKRLAVAEQRLVAFRRDHRIVALSAKQEADAREFVTLESKVRETESNIQTTKAQIASVRARLVKEPIDIVQEGIKDNPRRAKLQDKLDEMSFKRVDLVRDFRPGSREVQDLDRDIARLEQQLKTEPEERRVRTHVPNPARLPLQTRLVELETNLQGALTAHDTARAQLATQSSTVDNLGPWEVQLSRIKNERDATQSAYNALSNQLRDLELRTKARIRTARAIQRASVPFSPVPQRRGVSIAISALLALCLACGAAFVQEQLDDRLNVPEDVERIGGLLALGHVPLVPSSAPGALAALSPRSHAAEAYRTLRSSITFAGMDTPVRSLLVTSPSPGEGKTTTAVNLAAAMAVNGKRVVLVDADMRRPNVHRHLDLPPSPGLSELLVGVTSLEEALRETDVENLRVICAGAVPPNPAELLGAASFDALLAQLEGQADLVIFDTPPCLPVTDPLVVAARTDGVILVLHMGETRRATVKRTVDLLSRAHARLLGAVMNRVEPQKGGYYHHYYATDRYYGEDQPKRERVHRNGHDQKPELQEAKALAPTRTAGEEEKG